MFNASAAPRWNRQMSTFPRAYPYVAAPLASSEANALRRRKLGARPRVTKDSAPDLTNTLRFIVDLPMSPRAWKGVPLRYAQGDGLFNVAGIPVRQGPAR